MLNGVNTSLVKSFGIYVLLFFSMAVNAQDKLQGNWSFQSINDAEGTPLFAISPTDSLTVKDGIFYYHLKAKDNLKAEGKYDLQGDSLLAFHYTKPTDTTRFYAIEALSDSMLTISENQVFYHFTKNAETQEIMGSLPLDYDFNKSVFSWNSLFRGLVGLLSLVFLSYLFSVSKKDIKWGLAIKGLLIQFVFAFAILKVGFIRVAFDWLSGIFVTILSFTEKGSEFLFSGLISDQDTFGYIFAFQVLPTVIFFSALTSLLFYYGILQKVVYAFAWIMKKTLKLSGAESLAAAGNIFIGQTEAPLLVKPYIEKMTLSELFCLMSGGMATIAGGVLGAYIGFLGGDDIVGKTFFAKHLLAASVMSAPAAIVAAKIIFPEREKVDAKMEFGKVKVGSNALEAISNGTTDGLKLAVNVGAMLLVFVAFIAMANSFFNDFIGANTGLNAWVYEITDGQYDGFSFQFILGSLFAPLSWLMGVANEDLMVVGQLLGEKTILNEFVAYTSMADLAEAGKFQSQKSVIMATYMLCGFSNLASIGIQIGGIGVLAPSRKGDLAKLGFRALVAGTLASLFTAVIVGMLV